MSLTSGYTPQDPNGKRSRGAWQTPREVLSGTAWLLVPMSVLPLLIHYFIGGYHGADGQSAYFPWICAMVGLWAVGSILLPSTRYLGRMGVTGAIFGTLIIGEHPLSANPVLLLTIIILVMLILSRLWLFHDLRLLVAHYAEDTSSDRASRNSRLAFFGAAIVAMMNWGLNAPPEHLSHAAAFAAAGVANLALFLMLVQHGRHYVWRIVAVITITAIAALMIGVGHFHVRNQVLIWLLPPLSALLIVPRGSAQSDERIDWWEPLLREPSRVFITTFVFLSLGGAIALLLPMSTPEGQHLSFIDALFMSVSAVCVTGLETVDPGANFSTIGQGIYAVTMQLGGLGIMTFSLIAFGLLQRVSLRVESFVAGFLSEGDRRTVRQAIRIVLGYTFGIELIGACILAIRYAIDGLPLITAIGHGVFSAISAFNNAGHMLTGSNLMPYAHDPTVILTIAWVGILGGLSPFLVLAMIQWPEKRRLAPAHKLALYATGVVLAVGFIGFLVFEWHNTMRGFSVVDKLAIAFFQSASVRTAGFTTVDLYHAKPATIIMFLVLMCVGGSPGGTAGGIKTTTAAVLVLAVFSAMRGHKKVRIGNKVLPHKVVYRAAATAMVMAAAILGFSLLMILTQSLTPRQSIFEVVSALTTTGHSLDATTSLDTVGKSIAIACMLIGRVGMLTFFMFMSSRELVGGWQFVEEDIDLG